MSLSSHATKFSPHGMSLSSHATKFSPHGMSLSSHATSLSPHATRLSHHAGSPSEPDRERSRRRRAGLTRLFLEGNMGYKQAMKEAV
ncbi:MAG: hypothetical protein LBG87_09310 [Spirochaetaceae bacterium]|nr:hypothetical protein [Spirochaetaceae bacterium]